MNAVYVEKDNA